VRPSLPTAQFSSLVHGARGVASDDPAENFHEASRLYPRLAPERLDVLVELATGPGAGPGSKERHGTELARTLARSSRTHEHRHTVVLPPPAGLRASLGDVLARRRSRCSEALRPIGIGELATVLAAAYASGAQGRRPVPSAGALYPLELYVIATAVNGLDRGIYHFNPFRLRLARLAPFAWHRVRAALVEPAVLDQTSALVVVTAVFPRSRVKYGQRGYRFALLEAGHLVQNAVLAATELGLRALPLGGFHDRLLDQIIGVDSLDEAAVHALVLGGAG
jgi:SagB-type dehydrogenase family enzyme